MRKLQYFKLNPKHQPTAKPSGGFCPTCNRVPKEWGWCGKHFRWEGVDHLHENHGVIIGDVNAGTTRDSDASRKASKAVLQL